MNHNVLELNYWNPDDWERLIDGGSMLIRDQSGNISPYKLVIMMSRLNTWPTLSVFKRWSPSYAYSVFEHQRFFELRRDFLFRISQGLVFFPEHCQDLLFLISQTLIFSNTTDTIFFSNSSYTNFYNTADTCDLEIPRL